MAYENPHGSFNSGAGVYKYISVTSPRIASLALRELELSVSARLIEVTGKCSCNKAPISAKGDFHGAFHPVSPLAIIRRLVFKY